MTSPKCLRNDYVLLVKDMLTWSAKEEKEQEKGQLGKDLPEAVQVAEVQLLPEAAAKPVTDPAGDGEHPQSHRKLG